MLSFYKKYAKTFFDISLLVLTVYLFMWLFSIVYSVTKPIVVGLFIFLIIEPIAQFFYKRGIKKSIATTMATLFFVLVILGAIVGAGILFVSEVDQLSNTIKSYGGYFQQQILTHSEFLKSKLDLFPDTLIDSLQQYTGSFVKSTASFVSGLLQSLGSFMTAFTKFLFNFVIGLVLAYFLSLEFDSWKRIGREKTPQTFKNAFYFLKENVIKGIMSYIKAQSILVFITFIVILVSLLLLGVSNAFSIALLAAVFDILPVLGVSTVFVPWIIYLFVVGNTYLAIWLLVIFGSVILVRQILEPKITGESLGVSAFTMLAFMIISLSMFGVAGVILSPILLILIKALYDQGYLSKWIRKPEGEYEPATNTTHSEINDASMKHNIHPNLTEEGDNHGQI